MSRTIPGPGFWRLASHKGEADAQSVSAPIAAGLAPDNGSKSGQWLLSSRRRTAATEPGGQVDGTWTVGQQCNLVARWDAGGVWVLRLDGPSVGCARRQQRGNPKGLRRRRERGG